MGSFFSIFFKMKNFQTLLLVLTVFYSCNDKKESTVSADENQHPKLILTKKGVEKIRASLGSVPIFDKTLEKVKKEVDAEIADGIKMPIPKHYSAQKKYGGFAKSWCTISNFR